jgi:type IV fimbrial biogenesis protein FimT
MMFRGRGFSLIELVIAIAILGILLGLGLPTMVTYSRNIKVRTVAESFLAGIQLARGEAVRLNSNTELILTNATPAADLGSDSDYPVLAEVVETVPTGRMAANQPTARASAAGSPTYNWLVRTLPTGGGACGANPGAGTPAQQALACWFLAGRRGAEGSGSGADSDSPVLMEGPGSIGFTPLGSASAASEFNFSSTAGACAPLGAIRCLRVRVELGGRAKLCDPAATGPGDTRGCS